MKPRTSLHIINYDLPGHLSDLLNQEVNNIKYHEIDTTEKREAKLKQIQEKLLWQEVEISDFKVIDHRSEKIKINQSWENPFPVNTEEEVFFITLEAETTGSSELFNYSPVSFQIDSSMDPNIYDPTDNKIVLELKSKTLDKKEIINQANKTLKLTKSFIESNNHWINDYNRSFINTIIERFNKKADEIERLYS
ncbi:hypothetical protein SAMN05444360_11973 [Chryseobacterium carnipullorum]|uniref:hypothetical protein n=1 Tax=Chryseobacterium carnipullorum TaxID=1124835 RepID=UPI000910D2CD|nr:hypothetical protein [Chryseobacterium carnipullorum]SHM85691.1 hypothetical protein SAMN05444360_11973 [Chryseobacterium carnipullorum]